MHTETIIAYVNKLTNLFYAYEYTIVKANLYIWLQLIQRMLHCTNHSGGRVVIELAASTSLFVADTKATRSSSPL